MMILIAPAGLLLLQIEPSPMTSEALRFVLTTALFLAFVITALFVIFKYLRSQRDSSGTAKLREEFEKSKDVLLATAMAKKQESAKLAGDERELSAEDKERELLLENVSVDSVLGHDCPLCGLEQSDDEELIVDPYSGAGYHLSCFLNAWPLGEDGRPLPRPKFVYRYPQETVTRSSDLIHTF